ncbi:hypothetical protein [Sedimenticola thiotaurini]|uniref:DUF983 domain-containing protein n=1 Tax=Sedimenticola thiotaurini TaxID=1543721 RepID=A0A0F7JTZ0_9GAMM|nr:hypothetical protein [Sedimenticola thiotaurini]AKH20026.1 hypothetical protein AAY24_06290 [Sedimenticola thiotaurini]
MDIDHYHCPNCGRPIETWVARRPEFTCADCGQAFRSNYGYSLKRSALFGLFCWIGGMALGGLLVEPWQVVFVFGIEFGALLAFGAAFLLHRFSIRITPIGEGGERGAQAESNRSS